MGPAFDFPVGLFETTGDPSAAMGETQFVALGIQFSTRGLLFTPRMLALPFRQAFATPLRVWLTLLDIGLHLLGIREGWVGEGLSGPLPHGRRTRCFG